jgi:hypothetical protein
VPDDDHECISDPSMKEWKDRGIYITDAHEKITDDPSIKQWLDLVKMLFEFFSHVCTR